MSAAETAVRNFLLWLKDPESLRDEKAIGDLQAQVDSADDPIDELRLRSELKRLSEVDGSTYRNEFLAHAKTWSEDNDIDVDAFRSLGVSATDLRDAGLLGTPTARAAAPKGSGRRRRVSPDEIRAAVPSGTFSAKDLEASSGASTATVRKTINELVDEGTLTRLGTDPNWEGRGRAPVLYRKN